MKKNTKLTLRGTHKKVAKAALDELHDEKIKTPEEVADSVSTELAKFGVNAKEEFQVVDPITKEIKTVSLSRTGTQETDLIVALADPNLTRDRKDHALSMYLWGRGAESSSMMVDLIRYKGEHTKETRVFKSQMRFDFEALITSLVDHLETQARNTAKILEIDLKQEIKDYREWLQQVPKGDTNTLYSDFYRTRIDIGLSRTDRLECAMISQAIYQLDEAEKLTNARTNIALAREKEKGGGIFVDSKGRIYDATQPDIDEIVKADREATNAIEHE